MKTQKNYSYWDSEKSTFINKIYCKTGAILTGYSKSKTGFEGSDKVVLLEKWILRLKENKNCYFDPSNVDKIIFYLNKHNYESHQVLTLYPDTYKINNPDLFSDNRIRDFLYSFYKNPNVKMNPHNPKMINEDKIFLLSKGRFNCNDDLLLFCFKQSEKGFEAQRILCFYNNYKNRFL
jgi:hypothetical protein